MQTPSEELISLYGYVTSVSAVFLQNTSPLYFLEIKSDPIFSCSAEQLSAIVCLAGKFPLKWHPFLTAGAGKKQFFLITSLTRSKQNTACPRIPVFTITEKSQLHCKSLKKSESTFVNDPFENPLFFENIGKENKFVNYVGFVTFANFQELFLELDHNFFVFLTHREFSPTFLNSLRIGTLIQLSNFHPIFFESFQVLSFVFFGKNLKI